MGKFSSCVFWLIIGFMQKFFVLVGGRRIGGELGSDINDQFCT